MLLRAERQLSLDLDDGAVTVAPAADSAQHGEVFTRRWVVELILDLAGFTPDRDLATMVAVEPSCGAGAFLVPMAGRIVESCRIHGRPLDDARDALIAFDLLPANAALARRAVTGHLNDRGADAEFAASIVNGWVRVGDFLLSDHGSHGVDFVLGNPPYIRLEGLPTSRGTAYRRACPTMRGRSDIFVGFIETGLRLLRPDGVLGFIVADRWMHNQYGGALRDLVTAEFAVEAVLSMHDVDVFEERVSAYPAVTIIRRSEQSTAVVATANRWFTEEDGRAFRKWAGSRTMRFETPAVSAAKLPTWFGEGSSWPSGDPTNLALVAELERRFPPLEDPSTATRVGIGIATGLDDVYLTKNPDLVEADRLLPLLMTRDTVGGAPDWSGTYLVNPWAEGRLVDLADHPRLRAYLESHSTLVRGRHVARNRPERWYRTIDRVEPGLLDRPKLVIPDLKAFINPVLEPGRCYPHHGLYFVTSEGWDLEVLGGLLLSDIAELFVATYCVKMRGGCYRFQAQYLRRIRVPEDSSVKTGDRAALRRAFQSRDRAAASALAHRLYSVDTKPGVQPRGID
ncbi:MAG: Eco57I restriction-modification methylase domain-containing protein [Actinobacteria bacterium]|nr:Eco57I restriction-modification methylase domain-containing protein [Actinomycetota bacterium]